MTWDVLVARSISEEGISLLREAGFKVDVNEEDRPLSKEELLERVQDKDALLSLLTDRVDDHLLSSNPDLKIVANYAVGYDNIDVQAATRHRIVVTHTPGVLTEAVAEHTLALMMAAARRIVEADTFTRSGKFEVWGPQLFLGQPIAGKTLGIVGLGRIGRAVARRAVNGLGMKVIYSHPRAHKEFDEECNARRVELDALLNEADVVSLHVPFNDQTLHLIGKSELLAMKSSAILINTARGPIVEEAALVEALQEKRIFAAALDVFECEPAISCDSEAEVQLKDLDNVILTPHIASATMATRAKMARMAAQSIIDLAQGETPENVLNRDVLSPPTPAPETPG
jgi:D-3-phosphoglycerate dehydrogenase